MAKLAASTYGDALFELAVEQSKADALYDEAQAVITAFEDNGEVAKLLNHPKIDKVEKIKFIKDVFGKFVSGDMTGLLTIMVEKDRQADIIAALEYFCNEILEYKKIGTATVTTAKPLDEKTKAAVVDKLLKTTDYKDFNMIYKVDESLIGGMVIRIKDRVIDSSIKTKLDEMTKDLKKVQL
jgi:F-type H+-transporting ATPase subunit delta